MRTIQLNDTCKENKSFEETVRDILSCLEERKRRVARSVSKISSPKCTLKNQLKAEVLRWKNMLTDRRVTKEEITGASHGVPRKDSKQPSATSTPLTVSYRALVSPASTRSPTINLHIESPAMVLRRQELQEPLLSARASPALSEIGAMERMADDVASLALSSDVSIRQRRLATGRRRSKFGQTLVAKKKSAIAAALSARIATEAAVDSTGTVTRACIVVEASTRAKEPRRVETLDEAVNADRASSKTEDVRRRVVPVSTLEKPRARSFVVTAQKDLPPPPPAPAPTFSSSRDPLRDVSKRANRSHGADSAMRDKLSGLKKRWRTSRRSGRTEKRQFK